jgi:Domain of unknown function (DUF4340)
MSFRTTIILLVILLGVAAYLIFTSSSASNSGAPGQQTSPTLLVNIPSSDVDRLSIKPADGPRIVIVRHTLIGKGPAIGPGRSDWKLTEPVAEYADPGKVMALLNSIVTANSTAQVNIGDKAADFGLDHPQYTVKVSGGIKSVAFDVGRQVGAGDELYVRVVGKNVAEVVGAEMLSQLDTTAQALRLGQLLNVDPTACNWISIQRPNDSLVLEKDAGQWEMRLPATRPTLLQAEPSEVEDLISAVNGADAVGFGDAHSDAALLIGQPRATITLSTKRPSAAAKAASPTTAPTTQATPLQATIEFGLPDSLVGKNVWVRVTPPGVLARVPQSTMDDILKSSLDLRDRDVLSVVPDSIKELSIVKTTPPTTQPVALPPIIHQIVLLRRPPQKASLLAGPPAPTTRPATEPTTQAATEPATQPAVASTQPAPAQWLVISTRVHHEADDAKVTAALDDFNPLHVDQYLAAPPASTSGQTTYLVTLTPSKGKPMQIFFSDPGVASGQSPTGSYDGVNFNVPRSVVNDLSADFQKNSQ